MRANVVRFGLVTAVMALLALWADAGGRLRPGVHHAAAQRPVSAEDDAWIQRAVVRADVSSDGDRLELTGCLRARISTGTDRFEAIAVCYAAFQEARLTPEEIAARLAPELAASAAAEFGGPALSYEEELRERQRLIDVRTAQLLEALRSWGATPEQLEALRGPLSACMNAWGTVASLEITRSGAGEPAYRLDETVVDWCAEDLPDFQRLRRPQPTLISLGCPDSVIQHQAFSCTPQIDGEASVFAWTVGGGAATEGRSAPLVAQSAGSTTIALLICNGEPDPGTAGNCTEMSRPVTVEPSPPVVSAPGCPAMVSLGTAVVCTPTGVSNTTAATTWGWTASGGEVVNDGASTLAVTFTAGGIQSVTVIACNSARSCSPPVSQSVAVGPALVSAMASVRVNKSSYQADDPIEYCYTVPGAGPVRLMMTFSTGQGRVLVEGTDDGRGDCRTDRVTLPSGPPPTSGCVRLEYTSQGRGGAEQACFSVTARAMPTPSPSPSPAAGGSSFDVGGAYRGSFSATGKTFPLIGLQRFQIDVVRGMSDANIRATTLTRNTVAVTLRSNGSVLDASVELDVSRMEQTSRLTGTYRGRLVPGSAVVVEGASGPPALLLGTLTVRGPVETFVNGMANRSATEDLTFSYVVELSAGLGGTPTGRLILCDARSRDGCRNNPITILQP